MQTRQELILDFMRAMMATETTAKLARESFTVEQKQYAQQVYLLAAIFADEYLSRI